MNSDFKLLSWADRPDNMSKSSQSSESQLDPIYQVTSLDTVAQKILENLAKVLDGRSGIELRSEKNFQEEEEQEEKKR